LECDREIFESDNTVFRAAVNVSRCMARYICRDLTIPRFSSSMDARAPNLAARPTAIILPVDVVLLHLVFCGVDTHRARAQT